MADDKVTLTIEVDAKDAQAAMDNFGKQSIKAIDKVEKQSQSFSSSLKSLALPIAGVLSTITAAYATISEAIQQASEDAKLTRQIEASLRATDEASQDAVKSVLDFAESIKETTGLSDDLAKQTYITAKSFGVSSEEAKKLTKAALDYAAATGIDTETAVRQLGMTLDGTVGKVGNLGFEFRNLTESQLKAGAAVDLVSQKFGGTAAKELDTFQGATNQLKNAWDDLLKSFGKTATESSLIQSSLSGLAGFINDFTGKLDALRKGQLEISGANVLRGSGSIEDLKLLNKELTALQGIDVGKTSQQIATGFEAIIKSTEGSTKATADFEDRLNSLKANEAPKAIAMTGKALEDFKKKSKEAADAYAGFQNKLLGSSQNESQKIAAKYDAERAELAKLATEKQFSAKQVSDLSIIITKNEYAEYSALDQKWTDERIANSQKAAELVKKLNLEQAAQVAKAQADRASEIQKLFADPTQAGFTIGIDGIDWKKSGEDFGVAAAGILALAGKGREGARALVGKVGGAIGTSVLGKDFGPIVETIVTLLTQGKLLGAVVKEFVKAIPELIIGLADAIPEILSAIVETVFTPEFLYRLGFAIGKATVSILTLGITNFAPEWGRKIGEEFTKVFGESVEKIGRFFSDISSAISNFVSIATGLFKPLTDALTRLVEPIERLIKAFGGGGGKGVIAEQGGKITEPLKQIFSQVSSPFSKGGIVPMYAADGAMVPRGTDTIPAMLTPGELVVPRDMVGELGAFLSSKNTASTGSDTALLSSILAALQAPMVVNAEAKVNQNAFADIILQLNRQNMRMAV